MDFLDVTPGTVEHPVELPDRTLSGLYLQIQPADSPEVKKARARVLDKAKRDRLGNLPEETQEELVIMTTAAGITGWRFEDLGAKVRGEKLEWPHEYSKAKAQQVTRKSKFVRRAVLECWGDEAGFYED